MDIPHVTRWVMAALVVVLVLGGILFLVFAGCVPAHHGWTRAEVQSTPDAQQLALEKDREACALEGNAKGIYYQTIMGSLDVVACLERRGWTRIP